MTMRERLLLAPFGLMTKCVERYRKDAAAAAAKK